MDPLLLYPDPSPPDLARALDALGWLWKAANGDAVDLNEPEDGWGGAVVSFERDVDGALAMLRVIRRPERRIEPVLLILSSSQLDMLQLRDELFDDFILSPFHPRELQIRLHHLFWRMGRDDRAEVIEYGPLSLNLETYQAVIDGRPLDLTYMEYQLLKFLASHPGRVFERATLLSRVWGYEYYGGARTVDVRVRRLRAKLGEEHASLIGTVRSVGYRFGQASWS